MRAPLSPAQERLWLLQRLDPDNASYTMYLVRALRGPLDRAALTGALTDVLTRHESLRTRFTEEEGVPWAVVEPGTPGIEWLSPRGREEAERLVTERVNAPFGLADGPPVRVAVLRIADDEHVLCLTMHHIVADGWSLNVILDDLADCYTARLDGVEPRLRPLPVQAGDYGRWQRRRAERAVPYWTEKLADPPVPELPFRHSGGASGRGGYHNVVLPPATARKLQRLAGEQRTTLFAVLTAAYQTLLFRHTGQEDVLVGSVVAGRDRVELEPMVGYTAQTVILRGDLRGDPSFTDLIARTRVEVLGALGNSAVPFEKLSHPADSLLPSMLILHNQDTGARRPFGGLTVTVVDAEFRQVKVDLLVEAWSDGNGLTLSFLYDTGLFEGEAVGRLTDRFARLLESVSDTPGTPISALPIWTGADLADIRALAAGPAPVPAPVSGADAETVPAPASGTDAETVPELIDRAVRRAPEAVAVVCGAETVTYRDLLARAGALAGALRAGGVGPGDVVGVCLPRSVEAIVALLAVWRAGAAYLPFDPDVPDGRLAFSMADGSAVHVITRRVLPEGLTAVDPAVDPVETDDLLVDRTVTDTGPTGSTAVGHAEAGDLPAARTVIGAGSGRPGIGGAVRSGSPLDAAYVITTSGSTGTPKGVVVEHGAVAARVRWMCADYGLTAADHVVQFASLSFDAHVEEVFPALAAGATLVLLPDGAATLPDLLVSPPGERITVLDLPTAYWHSLVEELEEIAWPPSLRLVILGGEQVSATAVERWRERFGDGVRLVNTYGPTEAAVIATAADLGAETALRRPPIGRPIGATTVHVLDARGEPLPPGASGELVIGGAGVARGYLGRPALTAAAFVPDPTGMPGARRYRTGDRARWRADGQLEFLGRSDGQLKIRGFRIEPGEVESRLLAHPGVGQAFVMGRGEELLAYVTGAADPADLRAHLERTLPRQLVPTAWVHLDALPLTTGGKVDRAALPEPALTPAADRVLPRTDAERLVAGIWDELLGTGPYGIFDDFFALGGHSLLATRVAARIRRATAVEVPIRTIFAQSTVAALAEAVEDLLIKELAGMTDEEAMNLLAGTDSS
ncbi:amino acid adenylation domain-containing protein [Streptosporangium sp. NBC_01756]|uniref:amino acid adenylation domain-containing protein n=1 Tax=Streptosporangium sp. NBC_01756 TaxID=2975950 RepID=UPI002DD7FC0C|nr:amino acid adenylation domain-containing protein [Streptosporangium sp. NBC_01756]WSC87900.1 amino acid adenylation domain-containing protein [Streptosporangium sp. NBC_01756]